VYDGHGGSGDLVSHFTKKALPKHLILEMKKRGESFKALTDEQIMDASKIAFIETNKECHETRCAPFLPPFSSPSLPHSLTTHVLVPTTAASTPSCRAPPPSPSW
jgi:hypothetical protein